MHGVQEPQLHHREADSGRVQVGEEKVLPLLSVPCGPSGKETLIMLFRYKPDEGRNARQATFWLGEGMMAFALTMKDRSLDQISEQLENGRPIIAPVLLPRGRYFGRDLPVVSRHDAGTVNPDEQLVDGTHKHHYVVIFGQSEDKLLLMDPAFGIVKISKNEFTGYWLAEKNAALLCSSF